MHFSIQRPALKTALVQLRKAAGSRRGPPALRHVLVQVEAGKGATGQVRFTATDLDTVLTYSASITDAVAGRTGLPLDELISRLGGRGTGMISLSGSSRNAVEIVNDGVSTPLRCLPASELPPLPPMPRLAPVPSTFLECLQRASVFCSSDESRGALQGVHVDRRSRQASLVATDGHRLIALPVEKLPSTISGSITVPVLGIPSKTLVPSGGKVLVGANQKRFGFQNGPWGGSIQIVGGTFPDWRQVLPKADGTSRVIIPEAQLHPTAEMLKSLPIAKSGDNPLALISRKRRLYLRYQNSDGKTEEVICSLAQVQGSGFQLVVNRRFLLDAINSGFGIISVSGDDKPLNIQSAVKGERVVLMPLRHSGLTTGPTVRAQTAHVATPKPKPRKDPVMSRQQKRPAESNGTLPLIQQLQDACVVAKAMFRDGTNAVNEISSIAKQLARAQKHSASEVTAARKALARLKAFTI